MKANQDLMSAILFKEVPEGFVYRKPKLWPPPEFYLLNAAQRDEILAVTYTRKPWRTIAIFTLVVVAFIAVPVGMYIAWAPIMDTPNIVAVIAGVCLATFAASYLNV